MAAIRGEQSAAAMIDAARVLISDSAEKIEHAARPALAAVHDGDMLMTQLAVLKRFAKRGTIDTIAARRRIAAAVQSNDSLSV